MPSSQNQISKSTTTAKFLAGLWRSNTPEGEVSIEELEFINPILQGSGAGGLAWWRIRDTRLRDIQVGIELQQVFRLQTLQAAKHELDIQNVFKLMRVADIEPVLVKGWAIARRYPVKGLRPYGDIDLVVHPKDRTKAKEVTSSPEGKKYYMDFEHEELGELDEEGIKDIFAHSQLLRLADIDVRVMGEEDHLRFLCNHFLRHGAWRPLWLCDIAVAVESRKEDFDWQRCLGKGKNQADRVVCAIRLAYELLGANISNTPAENKILPKWLVPTVLKQWERPCSTDHRPPELIMTSLRNPTHILKAIRDRWPDPISASIRMNVPFNEWPRLPFQVAKYAKNTASFAIRLAKIATRPV